jgi:diguanylate cyclase (GGDEF)-like protein
MERSTGGAVTKNGWIFGLLLAAVAWPCAAQAAAADSPEMAALLQRADALRGKDPATLSALLARADVLQGRASETQRQHLRLLKAYRQALEGDYAESIDAAKAVSEQAAEPDLRHRAALFIANVAAVSRDHVTAVRYLNRAMAMLDRVRDPDARLQGLTVATTLYNELGEYQRALEHAEQALRQELAPRQRCIVRAERARTLLFMGAEIDETRDLHDAIAECSAHGEGMSVVMLRNSLARHYHEQGRTTQAVALLESNAPDARATDYTRLVGEVYAPLAEYRMAQGDTAGAEAAAREVLQLKGQSAGWLPTVQAHHVLYEAALARDDTRTALEYHRRWAEADKARLDDLKTREYAVQLARHEVLVHRQAAELLRRQNEGLQLRNEVARRTAWSLRLAVAMFALLAAVAAYWGWRSRRTHAALRIMAELDALTGLSNRRHFRNQAERMLAACAHRRLPVSVVVLDLDHFKQINDTCGHHAGDWVLREIARVGRAHCRHDDLFGRIGGEEFAMALIGCDLEGAMRIADDCRRAIAAIDASSVGCERPVSASVGIASTSLVGYDYETLVARADAAMYRSKVGGRNRVTIVD